MIFLNQPLVKICKQVHSILKPESCNLKAVYIPQSLCASSNTCGMRAGLMPNSSIHAGGNVFAEYYLAFKQAVLLAFGERGEGT